MHQNEICSICDRQPEDLLILVCQHNLCINCATEIFNLNEGANPFICEICLSETLLEEDALEQFKESTARDLERKKQKEISDKHRPPRPNKEK